MGRLGEGALDFMPAKLIASSLALTAFAVMIVAGLSVDNPAATTLTRALAAMAIAYAAGWAIGRVAEKALREEIEAYKTEHPIERMDTAEQASEQRRADDGTAPDQRATGATGEAA
jgi:uncharacterized protein (DUF697 family)